MEKILKSVFANYVLGKLDRELLLKRVAFVPILTFGSSLVSGRDQSYTEKSIAEGKFCIISFWNGKEFSRISEEVPEGYWLGVRISESDWPVGSRSFYELLLMEGTQEEATLLEYKWNTKWREDGRVQSPEDIRCRDLFAALRKTL